MRSRDRALLVGAASFWLAGFGPFMCESPEVQEANRQLRAGEAQAALEALTDLDQDQPEVHLSRGLAHLAGGALDEAVADLDQAYRLLAERAINVASGTGEQRRVNPAAQAALNDLKGRVLFARGLALAAKEQWEGASSAFARVLELDPTDDDARWNLELCWFRLHPPCPKRDDDHEEDDRRDQAQPFTEAQAQGRLLCPSDEDWYQLPQAPAGARLYVTVKGKLTRPEEDDTRELTLRLFPPEGEGDGQAADERVLAGAGDELSAEVGVTRLPKGGAWTVQLAGPGRAELTYEIGVEIVPPCPADDALEDNDDAASAAAVTDGEQKGLKACPGDEDWYRITVPPDEARQIVIRHSKERGPLEAAWMAYATEGAGAEALAPIVRAQAQPATGGIGLTIPKADAEQLIYVRIRTATRAENTYVLAVSPPEEGEGDKNQDQEDQKDQKDQDQKDQDQKDQKDQKDQEDQEGQEQGQEEPPPPPPPEDEGKAIDVDKLIDALDEHEKNPQLEKALRRLQAYPRLEDY